MEILGGPLFAVAGAGESHGPAITTIVFGCPPGVSLARAAIQDYLDRRRPGSSKHGTPRREADQVVLLSGIYQPDHAALLAGSEIATWVGDDVARIEAYEEGFTTGEPIAAVVLSTSKRPDDYTQFSGPAGAVRPGHTDLVKHHQSRGFVDVRGGGRSSYRSTISDVIGGSVARLFLRQTFGTAVLSSIYQVGPLRADTSLADHFTAWQLAHPGEAVSAQEVARLEGWLHQGELHAMDHDFAHAAGQLIKQSRVDGDSLGAVVEVVAVNVPPLLGEPLYQSLKLRIMGALGGLNAAQSCEVGDGLAVSARRGSDNNDPIRASGYQGNSHGGLLGGITSGMPLVCRVGFKPTSSIVKPQRSVRKNFEEIDFQLQRGRHDPCVGVRAGVTLESRLAIEVANAVLMHQARHIHDDSFRLFPPWTAP